MHFSLITGLKLTVLFIKSIRHEDGTGGLESKRTHSQAGIHINVNELSTHLYSGAKKKKGRISRASRNS